MLRSRRKRHSAQFSLCDQASEGLPLECAKSVVDLAVIWAREVGLPCCALRSLATRMADISPVYIVSDSNAALPRPCALMC